VFALKNFCLFMSLIFLIYPQKQELVNKKGPMSVVQIGVDKDKQRIPR